MLKGLGGRVDQKARDRLVLEFIKSYMAVHGLAPSYREIVAGCELSSTALVRTTLKSLMAAGLIEWWPGVARSIRLRPASGTVGRERQSGEGWA